MARTWGTVATAPGQASAVVANAPICMDRVRHATLQHVGLVATWIKVDVFASPHQGSKSCKRKGKAC